MKGGGTAYLFLWTAAVWQCARQWWHGGTSAAVDSIGPTAARWFGGCSERNRLCSRGHRRSAAGLPVAVVGERLQLLGSGGSGGQLNETLVRDSCGGHRGRSSERWQAAARLLLNGTTVGAARRSPLEVRRRRRVHRHAVDKVAPLPTVAHTIEVVVRAVGEGPVVLLPHEAAAGDQHSLAGELVCRRPLVGRHHCDRLPCRQSSVAALVQRTVGIVHVDRVVLRGSGVRMNKLALIPFTAGVHWV